MAAPTMPSFGNGPIPNIKSGLRTILIELASQSTRIAIAASPAPRKIALIKKSKTIVELPANMTLVKPTPCSTTQGEPPITLSSLPDSGTPIAAKIAATIKPNTIAWTEARAAPSGLRSPMRRATIAVAPMLSPIATAYIKVSIDSVSPTVVIASAAPGRICDTQKNVHYGERALHQHFEHHRNG